MKERRYSNAGNAGVDFSTLQLFRTGVVIGDIDGGIGMNIIERKGNATIALTRDQARDLGQQLLALAGPAAPEPIRISGDSFLE